MSAERKSGFGAIIMLVVGAVGLWWFLGMPGLPGGFSEDDIASVRRSIREEYEKKPGFKVEDVSMIKESSRKLTGFVVLKTSGISLNKPCDATMDENGRRYFWRCQ